MSKWEELEAESKRLERIAQVEGIDDVVELMCQHLNGHMIANWRKHKNERTLYTEAMEYAVNKGKQYLIHCATVLPMRSDYQRDGK